MHAIPPSMHAPLPYHTHPPAMHVSRYACLPAMHTSNPPDTHGPPGHACPPPWTDRHQWKHYFRKLHLWAVITMSRIKANQWRIQVSKGLCPFRSCKYQGKILDCVFLGPQLLDPLPGTLELFKVQVLVLHEHMSSIVFEMDLPNSVRIGNYWDMFTVRKRSLRRLCFYRCLSVHRGGVHGCSGGACVVTPGGVCMVAPGGCAWLLPGGHAWLLQGGVCVCSRGACMVAPRGACVVSLGGHVWLLPGGACVVALGGHAWLLLGGRAWLLPGGACVVAPGGMHGCSGGGMHGCSGGHAWLLRGGMHGFFDEIRSMSGRYASYWNAFLLSINSLHCKKVRSHWNPVDE